MAEKRAQDAHMSDQDNLWDIQRGGEIDGPLLQTSDGFTAGRLEIKHIGGPGVECIAVDVVPRFALPFAEIDLGEPGIDTRFRVERFGQLTSATQGAGDNRNTLRQQGLQALRDRHRVFAADIKPAIANSSVDQRARMTDQENLHNSPQ